MESEEGGDEVIDVWKYSMSKMKKKNDPIVSAASGTDEC
jgi:hypothetical protein